MSALGKLGLCLLLAATQQVVAKDPRQAQRERYLEIARRFAEFEWKGSERNVLHGPDANGVRIDTPDVSFDAKGWRPDGSVNHGMPYAWGGFTSIEQFQVGLDRGLYAGNVPKSERAGASYLSLGLDCSGFVARCWDLPYKQSTRSLGALCYRLPGPAALEPGDILNKFDGHVVLFERWIDIEHTRMRVYEAGRLGVEASEYSAEALVKDGFEPMRYKPLDERWVPMNVGSPVFTRRSKPMIWISEGKDATLPLKALESPLRDARPREWARYALRSESAGDGQSYECVTLVSAAEGQRVETQTEVMLSGKTLSTGRTCEHAELPIDTLLDFLAYEEPLGPMTVRACTVTKGSYELGNRRFPAYRVELQLGTTHVVRHQEFEVTLAIECVLSPEVPVHGVLEASLRRDSPDHMGRTLRFELEAFGGLN